MGNFNRDFKSGGGRFGGRNSGPTTMHQATCSKCGKECEVPFKPTGSKPVLCSNCFRNNGEYEPRRSESRRPSGGDFRRPSFEDRPMYDAVCETCAKDCKIPFQPRSGKPVFCSDCFEKNGGSDARRGNDKNNYSEQFEALNAKLDSILKLLAPVAVAEVAAEVTEEVALAKKKTKSPKKTPSDK